MRCRLVFSAAETVAFRNATGQRDARLPVKSLHAIPAPYDPWRVVAVHGGRVMQVFSKSVSDTGAKLPYEVAEPYMIAEPVTSSGRPCADALRSSWLSGTLSNVGQTRLCRASETRTTAHIARVELARVKSLTAEQLLACGVRQTADGWSHGDAGGHFGTPFLAFSAHWDVTFPVAPWAENPWAWVLHLDEPVIHTSEKESRRLAERLLREFQKNQARLEKMQCAALHLQRSQRQTEKRICRVLRAHSPGSKLAFGGYGAHFDQAFLSAIPEAHRGPTSEQTKESA